MLNQLIGNREFPLRIGLLNTDPQPLGSVGNSQGIGDSVLADVEGVDVALFEDGLKGHGDSKC